MKMVDYGERFRQERKRIRLKQHDVALGIGCSNVIISYVENGIRDPRVRELHKVYEVFGMDVGFSEVFKWIDCKNKELLTIIEESKSVKFFEKELKEIESKKYDTMEISTLEKIAKILDAKRSSEQTNGKITPEEQKRLDYILKRYIKKDGNIERALKLLENAVQ